MAERPTDAAGVWADWDWPAFWFGIVVMLPVVLLAKAVLGGDMTDWQAALLFVVAVLGSQALSRWFRRVRSRSAP
jgi:hypothetical protein